MRKLILLTTLISFVYFSKAQSGGNNGENHGGGKLRLGLQFSPIVSYPKSDKAYVQSGGAKLGYNLGLLADIRFLDDNYYFGTGINLINSPIKLNHVSTLSDTTTNPLFNQSDVTLRYKLQYIGIPLTLKLRTNNFKQFRYFVQFGVEPQVNISKKVNANKGRYNDDSYYNPSETKYSNYNADISFVRLAGQFSGGFEYFIDHKTALMAGLSYSNGLTDISMQSALKITNNYIALNLGIFF